MSNMEHEIKACLMKIKSGDIFSSVKDVESLLKKKNQENVAINILVQTSSSVASGNLHESTTTLDIFKVSQSCCVYLKSGVNDYEAKYLSALHHIMKYLIQKGNLVHASNLMNYLYIVKREEATDDDMVSKILYATYHLFKSKLMEELQCAPDVQSHLKLLKDTGNILMCCGAKYLSVVVDHALLFLKLIESETDNNNFNELFQCTLYELELYLTSKYVASNINSKSVIKCVNILWQLVLKCVELGYYEFVSDIVNLLASSELNFRNDSAEAHCFKLFRLTLSSFVSEKGIDQEILKDLRNYLVTLVSKYGAHDVVENVCMCITSILSTTHKKWLNWRGTEWTCQWNLQNIDCLHKIIIIVIQVFENFRSKKSNITEEEINSYLNNIVYTTLLHLIILSTSRCYLSNCNEFPENLVLCALDALKKCVQSITELKQKEFPSWTSYWTKVVFEVLKISQELANREQWLLNQKFYANLCKAFVSFGDTGQQSYSVKNGTLNAFIGYIKASLSLKEYEKALNLCSVALVLLPDYKEKIFDYWRNAKLIGISEGFHELEQYSLLNLFEEENNTHFSEFPSLKWDKAVIEEYFIAELEYYCRYRVVMFDCLYAVSKNFFTRVSNSILNARVAEILVDAACSQEDIKILQHCSSIGKEMLSTILQCKHVSTKVEKFKLLALLGNLHYRIFMIDLLMLQIEQKERIDNVESNAPKIEPKDDKDLVENVYKVASTYENLPIEREAKLVQQLNTAVHYWLQLLDLEKYADMEYLKSVISNIENVANLYGLFGCASHEINAWGLYYKLNVILGSDTGKLQAVSFILRLGNFETKHLLEECDGIAKSLEIDNKCKVQHISFYCNYLLGKSWMSLKNLQMELGATYLMEVRNLVAESSEYEHKLLLAECYYLLSKYLSVNDWEVPPQLKNELSLSFAYTAFWMAKHLVKEKRRSIILRTRFLYIILQLVEWLTEIHIALRWTIEIFSILKEFLVMCQVAVLPVRSSQIFAFMAGIHLIDNDINDCKSKISSLEKILNLKSYKIAEDALNELKNNVQKWKLSSTDRGDSIFQKHMKLANFSLDKDVRNKLISSSRDSKWNKCFVESSTGSPDFRNKVPKVYRAMAHKDDCRCYMCQNFASHTVVIHYYYIIALLSELVHSVENIIPTYEAGLLSSLCLYEKEAKQVVTLNKTFTEVTGFNITFSEIQDKYKIYCTKYIALFSDFLASHKIFREASELNTEAICLQESVKGPKTLYLRDIYAIKYGLAISQLCNLENSYEETPEEKTVGRLNQFGEHLRTPELKLKCSKNISSPVKDNSFIKECKSLDKNDQLMEKMKQLIFDSSDSEDDFLHKNIPEIIITDFENLNIGKQTGKKPNAPKGINLKKDNPNLPPKNIKNKNNFSVYLSPDEKKQTNKKEKIKSAHHSNGADNNETIQNKLKRSQIQRESKNASQSCIKPKLRNKQQKTSSLYESPEEKIEQSTENSKLDLCHDTLSTNSRKTSKNIPRIIYSSSDEETKSTNPTKLGKSVIEASVSNLMNREDKSVKRKTVKSNVTTVKGSRTNRGSSSRRPVTQNSCEPENETNPSNESEAISRETSKCDIIKPSISESKTVSASGHSKAKEPPSRRVTRKRV